jgi:tRNA(fMet)-specific endonuclease VapC
MKPKYLLDTNICIYLMKHQPPEVAERFTQCFVGDVVISAITLAELEYGVTCSGAAEAQNRLALDSLLQDILAAPFEGPRPPKPMVRFGRRRGSANAMRSTSSSLPMG